MSAKTCPECGTEFSCEGDNDCWCEQVPIHKAQWLEILERYTDCLCPVCLDRFRAEE